MWQFCTITAKFENTCFLLIASSKPMFQYAVQYVECLYFCVSKNGVSDNLAEDPDLTKFAVCWPTDWLLC